mgnify:CR=1 FL=1
MSRSRKKVAIVKDSGKVIRYWRTVRRRINTVIHSNRNLDELELPNPKTIVNDYDYCNSGYYAEWCRPTKWNTKENIERDRIKIKRK